MSRDSSWSSAGVVAANRRFCRRCCGRAISTTLRTSVRHLCNFALWPGKRPGPFPTSPRSSTLLAGPAPDPGRPRRTRHLPGLGRVLLPRAGLPGTAQPAAEVPRRRRPPHPPGHLRFLPGDDAGMILDASAPLYGRASQVLPIGPLPPSGYSKPSRSGVSRRGTVCGLGRSAALWELARGCTGLQDAIEELVLDRYGVLHGEPERLLLDDMRSAVQANSLLSLIANGCHRLSEIAGRLGKPAGHLARPLAQLIDWGISGGSPFRRNHDRRGAPCTS